MFMDINGDHRSKELYFKVLQWPLIYMALNSDVHRRSYLQHTKRPHVLLIVGNTTAQLELLLVTLLISLVSK